MLLDTVMIQIKEGEIEKIIHCDDPQSINNVIVTTIVTLKEEGLIQDTIMSYIQELDLSLALCKSSSLSPKQCENIKLAQQILMNKIINGIDA